MSEKIEYKKRKNFLFLFYRSYNRDDFNFSISSNPIRFSSKINSPRDLL